MSQRSFAMTAGIVFLLIALAHLLRVVFEVSLVVYGINIPMWASIVAVIVMGLLSYEGFHTAWKVPPRA